MTDFRARTKLACRIAGLHPDRFNEAVAAGNYRTMPPTKAGSARLFGVVDIVALRVYRELLDEGLPPSAAGRLAGLVRIAMPSSSRVERIVCVRDDQGRMECFPEDEAPRDFLERRPIISRREWRTGYLHDLIVEELTQELPPLGED